jgi:cytochrome b6-f complex iron-sulfur subunit
MSENVSRTESSRRGFLDWLLGASVLGWLAGVLYPVIHYLKPLPQTGPTGPTRLTREEMGKLDQQKFVIVPVSGQRVIVIETPNDQLVALGAKCTHEGCIVTYRPDQSIIWCPCHDGRYDLSGRVLSGPPPSPLPQFVVQRQPDGNVMVATERAVG